MGSTRKKISIHDYPEHLNPFSDSTVQSDRGGKMQADRLSKSGTWSSKITKRVNRSVTWIEKSWLGIEDPRKYKIDADQTCIKSPQNTCATKPMVAEEMTSHPNSCEKRDVGDHHQLRERVRETIVNSNENSATKYDAEKNKFKKKKKRPAPPPPGVVVNTSSSLVEESIVEPCNATISEEKNEEMESLAADTTTMTDCDFNNSSENNEPLAAAEETTCSPEELEKEDLRVNIDNTSPCHDPDNECNQLGLDNSESSQECDSSSCEQKEVEEERRIPSVDCSNSQDSDEIRDEQIIASAAIPVIENDLETDENANDIHCSEAKNEKNQSTV